MRRGAWNACGTLLLLFAGGTQNMIGAQSNLQLQQRPSLLTRELAAKVRKSLVVVLTQDHEGNVIAQGSGFFFRPGFIATNLHVLKRASQGYVKSLSDGVSYKISSVVGFDLKHDICVLKLSEAGGAPLPLSTVDVAVGDDVLVAGNPEGLEASFSKGIVSGIRSASDLIQMDAAISPGSSGGPVVNQRGEVVGLAVSSLVEGQNLNFAAPVRYLREQKLVWNLSVRAAGGLAVNGLEEGGFHGPVRIVAENRADYTRNKATNGYVEGPAVPQTASKYNRDGQVEEVTFFKDGLENGKQFSEYSDDGLLRRITDIDSRGRGERREYSAEEAATLMGLSAKFDMTDEVGTKGERSFHEDKYDSNGHHTESTFPERGEKWVVKCDSRGREIESSLYRQGELVLITHSTYEDNERDDWIRRHETGWNPKYPEDGFIPWSEYYREITYYSRSSR